MKKSEMMTLMENIIKDHCAVNNQEKTSVNTVLMEIDNYIGMLIEWGKIHNIISSLLGRENIEEVVLDSLMGSIYLNLEKEVYDVGSGGGLPGIPMALLNPTTTFHLIESDRKKCSFLRTVKSELNLSNVKIHNARIETFHNLPFIVSKAAFAPKNMVYLSNALVSDGILALWATPRTAEEYKNEAQKIGLVAVRETSYEIPLEKKRRVMIFKRA